MEPPPGNMDNFEFTFDTLLDNSARIEVDPDPTDNDKLEGVSLTESIFNYQKENGRTYHAYRAGCKKEPLWNLPAHAFRFAAAAYYFPNDQIEVERLNDQHELIKILMDGRNYLAPWSKEHPPTRVLDVATGTGRWAVEMGDEFPSAEVIGIDLSPIQPTMVPPNVNFFVEDATDDWHEEDLDYIHTRFTTGCWADMYGDVVAKAYERLQPGGWLESQELRDMVFSDDGSLADDSPLLVWCRDIVAASERAHRSLSQAPLLREWFEAAGFVDVQEKIYKLPINGWPRDPHLKKIGELWQLNMQNGLQAFSYGYLHRVLDKSKAEIEVSLVNVRKDIANPAIHAYSQFYVVWGRKPYPEEVAESSSARDDASSITPTVSTPTPTPTIRQTPGE